MIRAFHIENFKAFGDRQDLPIKPLTVLFGPNSAGKSSAIHALLYGQATLTSQDPDVRLIPNWAPSIDIGGFSSFVHGHDESRCVEWGAEFDLSAARSASVTPDALGLSSVAVTAKIGRQSGNPSLPLITERSLLVNGSPLVTERQNPHPDASVAPELNRQHPWVRSVAETGLAVGAMARLLGPLGGASIPLGLSTGGLAGVAAITGPLGLAGGVIAALAASALLATGKGRLLNRREIPADEDRQLEYARTMAAQVRVLIDQFIARTRYIGPLRNIPPRNVGFPVTCAKGTTMDAWQLLATDSQVRERVNAWLSDETIFRTPHRFEAEPEGDVVRLRVLDIRSNTLITHLDVGTGITQVSPILVQASDGEPKIIIVEQPELHLHPKLQAELGDVFLAASVQAQRHRFVLETHSEAMILRILRRIRETEYGTNVTGPAITPEHLALVYVEPSANGAVLQEIRVASDGQLLDNVPGGFFEETSWEMF